MSISNQDIDTILNNLNRNGLGVNNTESIFTTDRHVSNRNSRNNIGIESLIMLLSELNTQRTPPSNTQRTSPSNIWQGGTVPNSSDLRSDRVAYRVSSEEATRNGSPVPNNPMPDHTHINIIYPEFEEMMYSYNRNILEYNHTIQQMIDGITTSIRQRSAIGITEMYETGIQFNRNIHEYNKNMDNAMDLYRDIHFNHNSHDRNNYSVPLSTNADTTTTATATTTPRPVTTPTNTLPVIPRPQSMVSYTIFPLVPSVTTEPDNILLSEIQIHDFTENFIYNTNDVSNTSVTVCPISLESFQEGDSILKIRHCGHIFKSVSLRQWFRRSSRCPLCRCNLLSPSINRTSRSPSVAFADISMNVLGDNVTSEVNSEVATNTGAEGPQLTQREASLSNEFDELSTINQEILPDSIISNDTNSNIMRELYTTFLNTTNDLDQSVFNDVFQNILMESTDAPPNISSVGEDSISNIRPLILSLLQNSIESIDITYTVDYDISNN
jgi:hypothetical protein